MTVYQSQTRLTLVAGACLAATSAVTLAAPQRGMLSTFPVGLRISNASASIPEVEHLKEVGDQVIPPAPFAPTNLQPNAPDYTTMFPGMQVDMDAVTTGNGEFPIPETDGSMDPGTRWVVMSVSISALSTPTLPGPFFDAAAASGTNSAGSAIVSYYFDGSGSFPASLPGATVLEMAGKHLGFPLGGDEDVEAVDFGLGFMQAAGGSTGFFFDGHGVYFSVSPKFVADNNGADFARTGTSPGSPVNHKPHPADIYRIQWQPATSTWTTPYLEYSWSDLGFKSADCDVDALEIELTGSGFKTVVYSATVDSDWDSAKVKDISQLMVFHDDGPGHMKPTALRDVNGDKVATKIGIVDEGSGIDEVDAVCGIDPEPSSGGPSRDFANLVSEDSVAGTPLGLSISRSKSPGTGILNIDSERTVFHVTGWGDLNPTHLHCKIYRMLKPSNFSNDPQPWVLDPNWVEVLSAVRYAWDDTTEIMVSHGSLAVGSSWPSGNDDYLYMATLETRDGRPLAVSYIGEMEL